MRGLALGMLLMAALSLAACAEPVTTRQDLATMTAVESVAAAARQEVETLEATFGRAVSSTEVAALRSVLTSQAGIDPKMYEASATAPTDWSEATRVTMRVAQTKADPLGLPPVFVSMRWREDGAGWAVVSISDRPQ
ncbi:MAG: hypothetical protein C0418_02960 [Coriobacteriaceae bacterium]|nr:hypothetical protein [Coriobacteriaceae bacterium]